MRAISTGNGNFNFNIPSTTYAIGGRRNVCAKTPSTTAHKECTFSIFDWVSLLYFDHWCSTTETSNQETSIRPLEQSKRQPNPAYRKQWTTVIDIFVIKKSLSISASKNNYYEKFFAKVSHYKWVAEKSNEWILIIGKIPRVWKSFMETGCHFKRHRYHHQQIVAVVATSVSFENSWFYRKNHSTNPHSHFIFWLGELIV